MSTPGPTSVKAFLNSGSIRRFRLPAEATCAELVDTVAGIEGATAATIKWQDDDGDYVTIATDADLAEAIRFGGTLRLYVNGAQAGDKPVKPEACAAAAPIADRSNAYLEVCPPEGAESAGTVTGAYLEVCPPVPAESDLSSDEDDVEVEGRGHPAAAAAAAADDDDNDDDEQPQLQQHSKSGVFGEFPMPPIEGMLTDPAAMAETLLKSVFDAVQEGVKGIELAARKMHESAERAGAGSQHPHRHHDHHPHHGNHHGKHHGKHQTPPRPAFATPAAAAAAAADALVELDVDMTGSTWTGPGLRKLHAALVFLGYLRPKFLQRHTSSVYCGKTARAVGRFQRDHGIAGTQTAGTGTFDHATRDRMQAVVHGCDAELAALVATAPPLADAEPAGSAGGHPHPHHRHPDRKHRGKHKHPHGKGGKGGKGSYLLSVARELAGAAPFGPAASPAPLATPIVDLVIVRAVYGGADVTSTVAPLVQDGRLSVMATNGVFGDPLVGVRKMLEVTYRYGGVERVQTVWEGQRLEISPPPVAATVPVPSQPAQPEVAPSAPPSGASGPPVPAPATADATTAPMPAVPDPLWSPPAQGRPLSSVPIAKSTGKPDRRYRPFPQPSMTTQSASPTGVPVPGVPAAPGRPSPPAVTPPACQYPEQLTALKEMGFGSGDLDAEQMLVDMLAHAEGSVKDVLAILLP